MQAVILAAGKGKRLFPLTKDIPKAMLPINGKPILQILLEQLKSVNISDVTIIIHYHKEKIIDFFGNGSDFGININYVEQKEMKGTADAVLHAENNITDEKFLCIACDSLFETNLLRKLIFKSSDGVITSKEVSQASRYGILKMEGEKVLEIVEKSEKPPSNLANFSVYLFPKEIFNACKQVKPSPRGEFEINDAIKTLINEGKYFTSEITKNIIDIGTFEQLSEAENLALNLNL